MRIAGGGSIAAIAALTMAVAARAELGNEATAGGNFGDRETVSNTSSSSVPVAAPNRTVSVSVISTDFDPNVIGDGDLEAGDTLSFVIGVRNDGNVTMTGVMPEPVSIDFNGQAHAPEGLGPASLGPAILAPGASQEFSFVYTLSAADIYSAAGVDGGVSSRWTAGGTGPAGPVEVSPGTSQDTIEADPELQIAKSYTISADGGTPGAADTGDVITYSYLVTNTGNVALTNVHVSDEHEVGEPHAVTFDSAAYDGPTGTDPGQWGVGETAPAVFGSNADAKADDAVFETLGVGGAVTFTYTHRVTQAEFDAQ